MKKKTINHPERYEAPKMKVKMLRRRASLLALSFMGNTEGENGDGYKNEGYETENGNW